MRFFYRYYNFIVRLLLNFLIKIPVSLEKWRKVENGRFNMALFQYFIKKEILFLGD